MGRRGRGIDVEKKKFRKIAPPSPNEKREGGRAQGDKGGTQAHTCCFTTDRPPPWYEIFPAIRRRVAILSIPFGVPAFFAACRRQVLVEISGVLSVNFRASARRYRNGAVHLSLPDESYVSNLVDLNARAKKEGEGGGLDLNGRFSGEYFYLRGAIRILESSETNGRRFP